jgi:hypothetical protein
MLHDLASTALYALLCLLPSLLCLLLFNGQGARRYRYMFYFAGIFLVSELINTMGMALQRNLFPRLEWNWVGKLLVLAVQAFYAVIIVKIQAREAGLSAPTMRQRNARFSVIFACAVILLKFYSNYKDPSTETVTPERWIYQLTLPGIQEEFAYRSLYWALILRFMHVDSASSLLSQNPTPFFVIYPITLLFGMAHAVNIGPGFHVQFNSMALFAALLGGFSFAFLRWSTRSLYPSIVAHNLLNTAICVAQAIKS